LSLSSNVFAQAAPAPAKPAPAPAAPPAAPAPAPVPGPPPVTPAPAPPPADAPPPPAPEPTPLPAAPAEPAPHADPEPDLPPLESYSEGGDAWYDLIDFSAFVDAYAGWNFNNPKPQYGRNTYRAHDQANGFALSWVGVNASYPADPVGGTISLRFGPTATQLGSCPSGTCDSDVGLQYVKQAFVSWKPGGADSAITLDLGKFDTPYGVEVAESQLNVNYTRSFLYTLAQPSFHTGLRANFAVAEVFDFRLLAVNGWNRSIDNNVGKTFGAQGTLHIKNAEGADALTASLGYLAGPEADDTQSVSCPDGEVFSPDAAGGCAPGMAGATTGTLDRGSANSDSWQHLVDLVVVADPIRQLRLLLNADFGLANVYDSFEDDYLSRSYFGVLLGARVAITEGFGIGARGEYVSDPDGFLTHYDNEKISLVSGTLTLEALPADFLTVKLDARIDWSDKEIFNKDLRDLTGKQFTTTLGVVAHTN
ncbi:MAG TPA: porin, partial [Polyangiaceae bacterium]